MLDAEGRPKVERASLDLAFIGGTGLQAYVDATTVDAASVDRALRRARARRDGAAAERAEDGKRLRYPGPALVPFAVEAFGRAGDSAAEFLRSLAPTDLVERSVWLGDAWQTLSVLVQPRNAELLLSAEAS